MYFLLSDTQTFHSLCFPFVTFCSYLEEYIDEVKFCFNGVAAEWPEDCGVECADGNEDLDRIGFRTMTVDDETTVTVFSDDDY